MHISDVQQHAHAHDPDSQIACIGTHGVHMQNAERDLHRLMRAEEPMLKELPLTKVSISEFRKTGLGTNMRECYLHLPLHTFLSMWKYRRETFMRTLVGERGALEIYGANQKMLPHWHRFPWASFVDKSPNLSIPIRLHGDDAPHLSQGGAFMSVNFCSCVVNEGPVTDRKHLIGVVGLPGLAPDALQTWFDPVVESFWDAGSGSTDCPYRMFFTELVSDWKFKREILNLPYHYNSSKALCHECVLDKKDIFDVTIVHEQRLTADFIQYFHDSNLRVPALARLPGFDLTYTLMGDDMHELCCNGVAAWACGSTIAELCLDNHYNSPNHGEWRVRWGLQLRLAHVEFETYCKAHGLAHSQPMFTVASLSLGGGQNHEAMLKGKAANTMMVTAWLADKVSHHNGTLHGQRRALLMWSLAEAWHVLNCKKMWLDDHRRKRLARAAHVMMRNAVLLRFEAHRNATRHWAFKPKHHALSHTFARGIFSSRNPASHHCFSDESHIGVIKKLGKHALGNHWRSVRCSVTRCGFAD